MSAALWEEKKHRLLAIVGEYGKEDICLAFSGGVDSSLLLKLAVDSVGKTGRQVYAVTFDSRLHPACDLENAKRVAMELGGIHQVIAVDELEIDEIRNNPPDRCYLCKKQLFSHLLRFAAEKKASIVMEGTNEDDLHVYRPGIRAVKELGVKSPLAEAGFTKAEVKRLSFFPKEYAGQAPLVPAFFTWTSILPERNPSRSRVTYTNPRPFNVSTSSFRTESTCSKRSGSASTRATSPCRRRRTFPPTSSRSAASPASIRSRIS